MLFSNKLVLRFTIQASITYNGAIGFSSNMTTNTSYYKSIEYVHKVETTRRSDKGKKYR